MLLTLRGTARRAFHSGTPLQVLRVCPLQPLLTARKIARPPAVQRSCQSMAGQFAERPIAYLTIPVVASFVGWITNWMGVKMLFYPIDYLGVEIYRERDCPYGLFGWQGVGKSGVVTATSGKKIFLCTLTAFWVLVAVPARTEKMANRLVEIVSTKLLSLSEVACPNTRCFLIFSSSLFSPPTCARRLSLT